ncbi:hypothetical protein [Streptomyces netropsis]|uniref:Uncharacterized protein n=1 Tax=Streptomyces netropsis TaxID=55404 RepID=A0A7W7LIC2_STRNE|nr:hypothetical protein [Streptomyces netropsis]MBB4890579.1 hypothetical protein [Streptomyces netropsis]GGR50166.1 hypothetical protein GCM10010219_64360 [Streptomyces netropsis]
MIDLGKIPTFTGKLEELEKHAASLKKTASSIRSTGRDVHTAFQALDPVYDAPEQEQLLNSTAPVRDKADEFAKKLESVGGALQGFASTAKPLVDKMNQLRADAKKFVADNKDDDDWQKDQDKIDENARLVREVGTTWVAFQGVERDAANKITALVGSKLHFVVDDGSHKPGMYGFKESDVKDAKETPWGTVDKREHTGLRAAWEWTKDNVGGGLKGFFVDGAWGGLKGLVGMVNVFDQETFKKTWSGIGSVFGGVSAYVMTPYDWAMDKTFGPTDHSDNDKQKAALRSFGKSFVAWDEWGKNPSRAFGTVAFNVVTLGAGIFLKVGQAGKLGAGARAATVVGKAGVIVDPMTYVIKAGSVAKLKVGDLMAGLKASQAGVDDMARNIPTQPTAPSGEVNAPSAHAGDVPSTPSHSGDSASHSAGSGEKEIPGLEYVDREGNKRVVEHDGHIKDEHGGVVPDTEPVKEPNKADLPNVKEHETAPVKEEARVLEGASGPSHVENGVGHPTSMHLDDGTHSKGAGGSHATTSTGGHAADHSTGSGSSSHGSTAGGSHTPSGGGSDSHLPSSSGGHGAESSLPSGGRNVDDAAAHTGGHDGPGSGSHGNDGASHAGDAAHHADDASAPRHGDQGGPEGHAEGAATDAQHAGAAGADGGHGTPTPKPSTPADVAEQVKKANTNNAWFERYYRSTDGHRWSADARDENGRKLPILRKDGNGGWVNKFPPSEDATFKWEDARPGDMNKVAPSRLDDLQKAAERRQVSLDDLKKAQYAHDAAAKAFDATGKTDDVLKADLEEAARNESAAHGEKTDATEMFGEKAAEYHAIPEHYPDAKRIDDRARGNSRFDQIWKTKDGRYVVVEAKSAPGTALKDRWGEGPHRKRRVAQGTREYFETILLKMHDRGEYALADALEEALEAGKLDYVLVKGNPKGKDYAGYLMNHFDIG